MAKPGKIGWIAMTALLALGAWIGVDATMHESHSLRGFDGRAVGRIETAMWRSYYEHRPVRLFAELVELLREQYHLPFWRSVAGAWHAARAAETFQAGHNRAEYERALPDLIAFYSGIRRGSDVAFDAPSAALLELEWWIVHRERERYGAAELENSLAALQAQIYRKPARVFQVHAKARAEAMLLRDARGERIAEGDWTEIGRLLDSAWVEAGEAAR